MLRRVTRVLLLVAAACIALSATAAFAVTGPQTGTVVLKNYTFETNTAADSGDYYSYNTYRGGATGDYWWGRVTGHGYNNTGTGLWCAANHGAFSHLNPAVAVPAASYGTVNNGFLTDGEADFALDDTTGWYKSDFSYQYFYPSPAPNDTNGNPLKLFWYNQGTAVHGANPDVIVSQGLANVGAWTQVTYNRTGGTPPPFPTGAGAVKFEYIDPYVPGLGGYGATLDNIKLDGYKYGPVRSLNAVRGSGATSTTVNVTWAAPVISAGSTTVDGRAITYHVWRKSASNVYTEVGSGTSGLTVADTGVPTDQAFTYVVQAFDTANASLWGQAVTSNAISSTNINYTLVWRLLNNKKKCHLLTAVAGERDSLAASGQYTYEGVAFTINPATNLVPVYRFYNKAGGFYMYSADPVEANNIRTKLSADWLYQGQVFTVSNTSGKAVYRVRHIGTGNNRYYLWTDDYSEVLHIQATLKGVWVVEGVAFFIAP